jgi:hypothetical protein
VQLATRRNVEIHSLRKCELSHRGAHERFGCIRGASGEDGNGFAAPGAQVGLVVYEQRCPEFFGKVDDITATN